MASSRDEVGEAAAEAPIPAPNNTEAAMPIRASHALARLGEYLRERPPVVATGKPFQ
jgi:hypothetical protein